MLQLEIIADGFLRVASNDPAASDAEIEARDVASLGSTQGG